MSEPAQNIAPPTIPVTYRKWTEQEMAALNGCNKSCHPYCCDGTFASPAKHTGHTTATPVYVWTVSSADWNVEDEIGECYR